MCSLVESGPRQAMKINTHINTELTWLTGMAGLALPVVGTLAVEVVHQVDAASAIFTRVVSALIDIWGRRKIYTICSLPNCLPFSAKKCRAQASRRAATQAWLVCLKCCTHWGRRVDPPSRQDRSTERSSLHRCRSLHFHRGCWCSR